MAHPTLTHLLHAISSYRLDSNYLEEAQIEAPPVEPSWTAVVSAIARLTVLIPYHQINRLCFRDILILDRWHRYFVFACREVAHKLGQPNGEPRGIEKYVLQQVATRILEDQKQHCPRATLESIEYDIFVFPL